MNPNKNETIWYQWRKDGEDVGEETESGILFIHSISRNNAGNYTCRARNVANYSESNPSTLLVHCKYVFYGVAICLYIYYHNNTT